MKGKSGLGWLAASLILAGCGGGDSGGADTTPRPLALVAGEGKGSVNGHEFVPTYGATRVFSDTGHVAIVIGTGAVSCAVVKGELPPDGTYVQLSLSDDKVGTPAQHMYQYFTFTGGRLEVGTGAGSSNGTAQVLSATEDTLEVAMAYSDTVYGVPYAIDGTFQLYRCP
jgi:hypothetical protein